MGAHDQIQDRRRDARLQNHRKYCCFCIPGFKIVVILSFFAYQASKPEQILWFLRVRFQNHCKYCCFCVPGFKIIVNTVVFASISSFLRARLQNAYQFGVWMRKWGDGAPRPDLRNQLVNRHGRVNINPVCMSTGGVRESLRLKPVT